MAAFDIRRSDAGGRATPAGDRSLSAKQGKSCQWPRGPTARQPQLSIYDGEF